jgi:polyphosphate kinase
MANNLDLLFPGMEVESCALFRVTRNANTEIDEETADDLLAMIESELRERKFAPIVRLQVARAMAPSQRKMLATEFGLDAPGDVFEVEGMLGLRDFWQLARLPIAALRDPSHHPADHPELVSERSIFHVIRDEGSLLVYHPYQSYATSVERFLAAASEDPKVRAIKMTLYRTSEDSRAIQCLIDAARNGKQVAVVVELKARFDEEANIRFANRLEEYGIHVTYGVVGLKTHCKVILVVRHDFDGLRRYAHIGTGNYHAGTARLYADLGMLTCDAAIGRDLTELFNYLTTGYKPKRSYAKLLVAPKALKPALVEKIAREAVLHTPDSPGHIQIKTNALEDAEVTRALYRAAQAGVRVDLIVRDTCRLRAGLRGLSDNVRVVSVVGRFLEHGRIYYFRNGGQEEYFIGSADCMKRNLESRVEILAPVEAPALRKDLRLILDAQLSDPRGAWEMRADGSYVQRTTGEATRHSQELLIGWAEERQKQATRLRRRRPRGFQRRNLR